MSDIIYSKDNKRIFIRKPGSCSKCAFCHEEDCYMTRWRIFGKEHVAKYACNALFYMEITGGI